jgi:dihydrolipoamide dehydrogenase
MDETRVDVAVIGAGSAGLVAYRAARGQGKRVLLIEGGAYGTTCARVGCMPSKLLIAAAEAAHAVLRAPAFGVRTGAPQVDGRAVMARVGAERDRFVGFVLDEVAQIPDQEKVRGHARFLGPQRLQVDGHGVVQAASVVIATGSHPTLPPLLAHAGARVIDSDQVFEWDDLPSSVAVVGTGSIGLELGQALHRLGVRVVLFGRSANMGGVRDPEVALAARHALEVELDLRLQTELLEVRTGADGVTVRSRGANGAVRSDEFEFVLAATGRTPNLAGLDLQLAGLALDVRGVPLYDPATMQCMTQHGLQHTMRHDAPVFLAGDASGARELLHEAVDTGRIAGENAARFPEVRPGLRRSPLAITFSDPQIAAIGTPFSDLPAGFVCGSVSFENQGRSRVMLENRGLLRLYADGRAGQGGRLLGAEMCGPRAEHLGHLLAWAHQNGMTVAQMLDMPFYHPVIEEGLRTALRSARKALAGGLPERERCTRSTPGV